MTAKEHELRLKIDATPAKKGAAEFTAAIEAVKAAVKDLERDTSGAFSRLNKVDVRRLTDAEAAIRQTSNAAGALNTSITGTATASDKAAARIRALAVQSANALRVSTDQAARLSERLNSVGDTAGIDRVNAQLASLRTNLSRASAGIDIREARAGYSDLASELNRSARSAEILRAAANAETRALEDASRAATTHAEAMQRIRAAHDPVFASSQRYAAALREIDQLVASNTVGEAQANMMRERAAQTYLALGAAADTSAAAMKRNSADTMQGVMAGQQLYDVLIMSQMGFQSVGVIAMQQGSQLAAQMNTIKASGGSVVKTLLGGFTSLLNPLSLVVIGGTAVVAMLAQWAFSASEATDRTKAFEDSLNAVSTATNTFTEAARNANAPAREIIESYGSASATIREFLAALAEGEQVQMLGAVTASISTLKSEFLEWREYATGNWLEAPQAMLVFKDATLAAGDATGRLQAAMVALSTAKGPKAQYDAALALKRALDDAAAANGGLNAEQRVLYDRVVAVGVELGNVIGATDTATAATYGWANSLTSVRAEINAIMSSLAALGGSVIGNAAKRTELIALQTGQSVRQAEVARLTFEHATQQSAKKMAADAKGGVVGWMQNQIIKMEDFHFQDGLKLDDQLNAARSAARKASSGGGGGGARRKGGGGGGSSRVAELTDEQKAVEDLNKSIKDRLTGLEEERTALALVASGQFKTTEAANLMAQAMAQGGGAVDAQTEAMIRQIDAAAKLNEELTKAAKDPVKEWMASVPNWLEAGKQIEMGAIESLSSALSDMMKTGKFDIEALGDAVIGTIADIVADKAVKELLSMFGRDDQSATGGFAGMLSGLFGSQGDTPVPDLGAEGAGVASGGQQAGTTIATAMLQAGQQVSQQIAGAMTGAGSQAGMAVQSGIATGSNSVRVAGQQGLAVGANNIRMAASTGGTTLGQGVIQGAQQGAPILAQGVASGAGGGGGGGILSSFGGIGGLLSMAVGAFDVGGYSTSPANFGSAPLAAFRNAPHFAQGTANTSGIPAILHDNEAVIPLSKGRKIGVELNGDNAGGGGKAIVQNIEFRIQTPDSDSFRRSKKQVAADMAAAGQRALRQNR